MSNPFASPRPFPLNPEDYWDFQGFTYEHLISAERLHTLITENYAWLTHAPRTTREIYATLFKPMDCDGAQMIRTMDRLSEALWEFGFRTKGSPERNSIWQWQ